jgi:hypothetical protein
LWRTWTSVPLIPQVTQTCLEHFDAISPPELKTRNRFTQIAVCVDIKRVAYSGHRAWPKAGSVGRIGVINRLAEHAQEHALPEVLPFRQPVQRPCQPAEIRLILLVVLEIVDARGGANCAHGSRARDRHGGP